ncbi:MAG: FAD-binding protein, partial [bacterium (Candidatus Stahlbacteria) CG23_combo_of_CG06-09_8_20_14_all_40_9]
DAIDFDQSDEELELKVGAILVATGFSQFDPAKTPQFGYGKIGDVYTAFEFERMFASNGPTGGEIKLRNGEHPKAVAIVHCVGRKEKGYCSTVCCMYSLKFVHYLKEKLPEVKIYELYSDLCIPGKSYQKFYEETKEKGVQIIRAGEVSVTEEGRGIIIKSTVNGKERSLSVDMVILSPAIEPREDAPRLAKVLDIPQDEHGFFREEPYAPVATPREGVFIAGCAQEPKDIQVSVAQSEAAVGRILATL